MGWGLTENPNHEEIQELLGAFALGAVDDGERTVMESHLKTCESCRSELDAHRRLADALRRHGPLLSPLASVGSGGYASDGDDRTQARSVRRWGVPVAVAIMLLMLGGLFVQDGIRFQRLESRMERTELLGRAQLAAVDPAAVLATLRTPRNEPVLTVVSRAAGGESFAINGVLPPLGDSQTYQLWRTGSDGVTAAVTLGRRPEAVVFQLPTGVTGLILTVEKDPAPPQPTLPAVATARVPS